MADMDLMDVNEAFAAQWLAVQKVLEMDNEKSNMFGGAIALGDWSGRPCFRSRLSIATCIQAIPSPPLARASSPTSHTTCTAWTRSGQLAAHASVSAWSPVLSDGSELISNGPFRRRTGCRRRARACLKGLMHLSTIASLYNAFVNEAP